MPDVQKPAWSYFKLPILFTVLGLAAGIYVGGLQAAFLVSVLIVLEISLSFDNAVVNATVLRNWDEKWRKVFLFWGILFAVFFMRLIFPILLVSVIGGMSPVSVLDLALNNPDEYGERLTAMTPTIGGFGGAFLMMVGLSFFFDKAKEEHWLGPIERLLGASGRVDKIEIAVALLVTVIASTFVAPESMLSFLIAAVVGIVLFVAVKGAGELLGGEGGGDEAAGTIVKQGVMGFAYLELLDASFSFDGVIGAFALTTNLPLIMIGLGVGAFYVRETTIFLVDRGTLDQYRFLEHGAFWAILILAGVLFAKAAGIHLPEWFVGLSGATMIGLAVASSIHVTKREAAQLPA